MNPLNPTLPRLFACLLLLGTGYAQNQPRKMPREDVVHVPAIGDGLCVSNLFQSNMVLQRDKPVTIWGWAAPGEKVSLTFAGQSLVATAAADRSWRLGLTAMPASATPQTMTIAGKDSSLKLENILVGDVWVLGGQSNMEFELAKVDDGMLEIVSANFPEVRLLTVPQGDGFDSVKSFERLHEWSDWSGRHFRKGDWDVCSPESVKEFAAIGYVFGRRLHMAAEIPIGLIDASRGGTTVETWTPEDVVRGIDKPETKGKLAEWDEKIAGYDPQVDLQNRIDNYERKNKQLAEEGKPLPADSKPPQISAPDRSPTTTARHCYAGMIRPLEGLAVKGAVFHQGFNNCFDGSAGARMYYQLFGEMITAWRSAFGDEQLPFCIISLCTAGDPQTREHFLKPMYDGRPHPRGAVPNLPRPA